ncbi:retroviral-like aspartic protease family protein [Asticcacaulis machinosus]|uniref:Retroviral-like aspartic protease family protein n=1 Tax=Asticcacaulis machinosus TaxID=2984211 RepID=A0ABT5HJ82_9CAUL|nr:retroviral-like aspartic protease family protein [Asticcacaulis machinosus]MDC7676295.1 retroviral-like aspartic protease family protein [Asticcacaulis machinosus]
MNRRQWLQAAAASGGLWSAQAFAADDETVAVPIALAPPRRIVTSLTIGGKGPYYFILDTGASVSGIKPSLARQLNMRLVEYEKIYGIGGSDHTAIYQANDVVFGEAFRVKAMAMAGFDIFEAFEFDGLLAAGFLTGVPSRLDLDTMQLTFYPGGRGLDLSGYHLWPSRREQAGAGEKIYVDVMVDGLKANCLLDTGAGAAVNLASGFVRKHKLWDRYKPYQDRMARGIHGDQVKTRYVHAETVTIGDFPIKGAPLTLYDPKVDSSFGGVDGIVGMGAIGRFNHVFAADGIYVKPNRYFDDVQLLFGKPAPQP